jgi:D-3-phosphoglycerate dehydrogenase / 2-oxoglutarate reductase
MTSPINFTVPLPSAVSISPSGVSIHDYIKSVRKQEQYPHGSRVLHPIDNEDVKVLILENISQDAVNAFRAKGFHVDHYTRAMSEDELVEKIGSYHALGIRSKTKITARVVKAAQKVSIFVCVNGATTNDDDCALM